MELLPSEGPSVGLRRQIEAAQAAFVSPVSRALRQ
jgi:hypothetical protein